MNDLLDDGKGRELCVVSLGGLGLCVVSHAPGREGLNLLVWLDLPAIKCGGKQGDRVEGTLPLDEPDCLFRGCSCLFALGP